MVRSTERKLFTAFAPEFPTQTNRETPDRIRKFNPLEQGDRRDGPVVDQFRNTITPPLVARFAVAVVGHG
jgi:hypothetical protein